MNAAKKLVTFVKKETVLCIAGLLAVVSMFIIHPSADYFGYIDYRVLALLFCFMAVVAGFRSVGLFEWLIKKMLCYVKNARQLELVLVLGCFFASMWITNDVALLTFVPFAVAVLQAAGLTENLIFVIVMQTIAANLGSMCTPIGNPQNLYLYSLSGSPVTAFLKLMFPVTAVSLGLLLVTSLCIPKREIKVQAERAILEQGAADRKAAGRAISDRKAADRGLSDRKMSGAEVSDKEEMVRENAKDEKVRLCGYLTLFFLCILTVLHVLDYRMLLAIVIGVLFVLDRQLFTKPDYMLLITFVAFFILVGNIKNMDGFSAFLRTHVGGHELAASIFASQIISNVPAAVLLSGFTENINALILGTNIGGLGTLIASMASLISYKQYALTPQSEKGKYMLVFTDFVRLRCVENLRQLSMRNCSSLDSLPFAIGKRNTCFTSACPNRITSTLHLDSRNLFNFLLVFLRVKTLCLNFSLDICVGNYHCAAFLRLVVYHSFQLSINRLNFSPILFCRSWIIFHIFSMYGF